MMGKPVISRQTNRMIDDATPEPCKEPVVLRFTPLVELEHLLKVAGSVTKDAQDTWTQIWEEFRKITTPGGMILPEAKDGFVPSRGWPEFLEKLWLLKHYLDYVQRVCAKKQ
jgi:hypothetical protein